MSADCPFCARISNGEYDPWMAGVVSFEPLNPVTPGHRLFIPTSHVEDATTDPEVTRNVMYASACYVQYDRSAGTSDFNIITSIGPAATQTVRHLHLHVVPRREGDGLHLPWTGQVRP